MYKEIKGKKTREKKAGAFALVFFDTHIYNLHISTYLHIYTYIYNIE